MILIRHYDVDRLKAIRAWAEDPSHVYRPHPPSVIPGDDPRHVGVFMGVRVVYSITEDPDTGKLYRHATFSEAGRSEPTFLVCYTIALDLGFTEPPAAWSSAAWSPIKIDDGIYGIAQEYTHPEAVMDLNDATKAFNADPCTICRVSKRSDLDPDMKLIAVAGAMLLAATAGQVPALFSCLCVDHQWKLALSMGRGLRRGGVPKDTIRLVLTRFGISNEEIYPHLDTDGPVNAPAKS